MRADAALLVVLGVVMVALVVKVCTGQQAQRHPGRATAHGSPTKKGAIDTPPTATSTMCPIRKFKGRA